VTCAYCDDAAEYRQRLDRALVPVCFGCQEAPRTLHPLAPSSATWEKARQGDRAAVEAVEREFELQRSEGTADAYREIRTFVSEHLAAFSAACGCSVLGGCNLHGRVASTAREIRESRAYEERLRLEEMQRQKRRR